MRRADMSEISVSKRTRSAVAVPRPGDDVAIPGAIIAEPDEVLSEYDRTKGEGAT
jgi:hypothetical protein